jgi:hypothetical protein
MPISNVTLDCLLQAGNSQVIRASSLQLSLAQTQKRFFRHRFTQALHGEEGRWDWT